MEDTASEPDYIAVINDTSVTEYATIIDDTAEPAYAALTNDTGASQYAAGVDDAAHNPMYQETVENTSESTHDDVSEVFLTVI